MVTLALISRHRFPSSPIYPSTVPDLASGNLFKLAPVPFDMFHSFSIPSLPGTRCTRLILCTCPPQPAEPAFLQGHPIPFSGRKYLETDLRAKAVRCSCDAAASSQNRKAPTYTDTHTCNYSVSTVLSMLKNPEFIPPSPTPHPQGSF